MLRHSFGLEGEAHAIEAAVVATLDSLRTADLVDESKPAASTDEMTGEIVRRLNNSRTPTY